MKTLIICDDESVISKIDTFLQKNGIDTIIYRWLLKALDNLEEITDSSSQIIRVFILSPD